MEEKSNRKKMRVLRAPSRIATLRSPLSFAVARPQLGLKRTSAEGSLVSRFLIVTPRLELCAIKTKQTPSSTSNRYKTRFSFPNISGEKHAEMRRPEASGTNCEFKDAGRMPALQGRKQTAEKNDCAWEPRILDRADGYLGHRQECLCY
jgi:hypothetical protein